MGDAGAGLVRSSAFGHFTQGTGDGGAGADGGAHHPNPALAVGLPLRVKLELNTVLESIAVGLLVDALVVEVPGRLFQRLGHAGAVRLPLDELRTGMHLLHTKLVDAVVGRGGEPQR